MGKVIVEGSILYPHKGGESSGGNSRRVFNIMAKVEGKGLTASESCIQGVPKLCHQTSIDFNGKLRPHFRYTLYLSVLKFDRRRHPSDHKQPSFMAGSLNLGVSPRETCSRPRLVNILN